MLSRHSSCVPQPIQADPGCTIERLSGTRAATTFRKLPTARPGAKKMTASPTLYVSSERTGWFRNGWDRAQGHGDATYEPEPDRALFRSMIPSQSVYVSEPLLRFFTVDVLTGSFTYTAARLPLHGAW
jgi:hypothetical protein